MCIQHKVRCFFCFGAVLFPQIQRQFMKENVFKLHFDIWYFCIKTFRPIIRVENNNQEKLTIHIFLTWEFFLCYLDSDEILL